MKIELDGRVFDVKKLFDEKQIHERVVSLAAEINKDYGSEEPLVILMVLHGALLFTADLVRGLTMPTEIESVRLKSYHGTASTGKVSLVGALPSNLEGRNVLIVEDIVDSGRSIEFLMAQLKACNPKSVRTACLLDKPEAHICQVSPEYIGFNIGKNFVIGYGLDLDGRYRNLPYVAELTPRN